MTNDNNNPSERNEVGGGFGRQTESRGVPSTIMPIQKMTIPLSEFIEGEPFEVPVSVIEG